VSSCIDLEGLTLCERGLRFLAPLADPRVEPHHWGSLRAMPVLYYLSRRSETVPHLLDLAIALAFSLPTQEERVLGSAGYRLGRKNGQQLDLRTDNFVWIATRLRRETLFPYVPADTPTYRLPYLTKTGGAIVPCVDPAIKNLFGG
jgi:hypothetical protein